ncbi:MAG: response regulator transcription factor [Nitrospiraceae bacterium]|nr:response regulator transcription factor [Nitrospira sp.]MCA9455955.1 response regulator transcription factor [Nitrospira sp.]MCB9776397.1 response regulator transcription factor [Nitrospiraceae bacterium]
MKILVIEDDQETALYIANGLTEEGYVVDIRADGQEGLMQAMDETYEVLIVDRMVPGLDGLSLVRKLRTAKVKTPVLFLSALGEIGQRVEGLEAGGDDYLSKPFAFLELKARIEALRRRSPLQTVDARLRIGDLEMDLITRKVRRGEVPIDLQPREFRLLEVLMRNAGRVVTRTMLLEQVWEFYFDPRTSVVETHISRLRTKINKGFRHHLIHTVRGVGYRLDPDA